MAPDGPRRPLADDHHHYRSIVANQIEPTIGKRPIAEVTTPDLDAYYRDLLTTRKPATVRQTHAVLRRAFRQGVRWGWLATNPAAEATPPRVRRRTLKVPTPQEVAALIAAADVDEDLSIGCLLRVAAATGARRGELGGLRWSKVDLDVGDMVIDQAVARVHSETVVKDTKTQGRQAVHEQRPVGSGLPPADRTDACRALIPPRPRHQSESPGSAGGCRPSPKAPGD